MPAVGLGRYVIVSHSSPKTGKESRLVYLIGGKDSGGNVTSGSR